MTEAQINALPVVKDGDENPLVGDIKAILRSQGHWDGTSSNAFGPKLKAAVQYFQSTHLGPDGRYLMGDGVVGPRTWWALYHPVGSHQKSNIVRPDDDQFDQRYGSLSGSRQAYLRTLLAEHADGTHEIPDGSNGGDGVTKYVAGVGKVPWCALFQSWTHKDSQGTWPHGERMAHVQTWIRKARDGGYFLPRAVKPCPADLAVWVFSGGTGHISAVMATSKSGDIFNTIGGNEANRVKFGTRYKQNEPKFAGFIDLFGDSQSQDFLKMLYPDNWDGDSIDPSSTR